MVHVTDTHPLNPITSVLLLLSLPSSPHRSSVILLSLSFPGPLPFLCTVKALLLAQSSPLGLQPGLLFWIRLPFSVEALRLTGLVSVYPEDEWGRKTGMSPAQQFKTSGAFLQHSNELCWATNLQFFEKRFLSQWLDFLQKKQKWFARQRFGFKNWC